MRKLRRVLVVAAVALAGGMSVAWADEPTVVTPKYEIAKVEDVSYGSVKRYSLKVRVDHVLNSAELELVSRRIIEELKASRPHNAIAILYYLPDSDTSGPYTAGRATWAPYGDWGRAGDSPTGRYPRHQLVLSPGNAAGVDLEKVAVSELSVEQRKRVFYDLVEAQDRGVGDVEAYTIVARQYNLDESTVRKIAVEGAIQGWPTP